jgi:predicted PurR-regulated permease PerM
VSEPEPADHAPWPPASYWARAAAGVLAVVALAWGLLRAADVLMLVLLSLVLALGLQRPIAWLERRHVSRPWALVLMSTVVVAAVAGFLVLVLPSIIRSVEDLIRSGPDTIDRFRHERWFRDLDDRFDVATRVQDLADDVPSRLVDVGRGVLSLIVAGLTVLVLTLYFAAALPRLLDGVGRLLMPDRREQFRVIADQVTDRVGGYVAGNFVISLIAGTVTCVALLLMGVPYAAALAVWVAITDLIPSVGALLGAVVVLVVAGVSGSWGTLLAALVFVVVYQQVENYVIAPNVMHNAIDLSVGAVLIAVLVGGALAGFIGVVLALPVAASAQVVVEELYLRDRKRRVRRQQLRERVRRWRRSPGE